MGTLARPLFNAKAGWALLPILRRSRSDPPQSLQEPHPLGVRHAQVHLVVAPADELGAAKLGVRALDVLKLAVCLEVLQQVAKYACPAAVLLAIFHLA